MKRPFHLVLLVLVAVVLAACAPGSSPASILVDTITFEVPEDFPAQAWAIDIVGPPDTTLVRADPEPTRCDPGAGSSVVRQCLWTRLEAGQVVTLQLAGDPPSFGCAFWTVIGADRFPCDVQDPPDSE